MYAQVFIKIYVWHFEIAFSFDQQHFSAKAGEMV